MRMPRFLPRSLPAAAAIAVTCIALGLAPPAFATDPIVDLVDMPTPMTADGGAFTVDEVRRAIFNACLKRGWTPRIGADGTIVASILVRGRHYAEVGISWDADSYSIRYRDSRELDYDAEDREIHGNYNRWVDLLSKGIQGEFMLMPRSAPAVEQAPAAGPAPAAGQTPAPQADAPAAVPSAGS
jgi:hypothetical protein